MMMCVDLARGTSPLARLRRLWFHSSVEEKFIGSVNVRRGRDGGALSTMRFRTAPVPRFCNRSSAGERLYGSAIPDKLPHAV